MASNRHSTNSRRIDERDDYRFDITRSPAVQRDLGAGEDKVRIEAPGVAQIRITFTGAEVGNGNPRDSNTLANQDGGLAVRVQAENAAGVPVGPVSRFDDEGIEFKAKGDTLFDVRDLVSGASRGLFDEVILGTNGDDKLGDDNHDDDRRGDGKEYDDDDRRDDGDDPESYYINGGMGNDRIYGGYLNDFLVGGAGNDRLFGRQGDDTLLGGLGDDRLNGGRGNDTLVGGLGTDRFIFTGVAGNDQILDFASRTDKIDLSAYGITAANVTSSAAGTNTVLAIDSNRDGIADFQIMLIGVGAPLATDYIF